MNKIVPNIVSCAALLAGINVSQASTAVSRFFLHNYPSTQDLIAGQSNAAQYAVSDDIACGTQTILNWNFIAPNGAYFQGALTNQSTNLVVTNLTGTGQQICVGDALAANVLSGNPNIATTPNGTCSSSDGTYTLTVPQTAGHAAERMWSMTEDWTAADNFVNWWHTSPGNKYVGFLFAGAAAEIPQEMLDSNNQPVLFTPPYVLRPGVTIDSYTYTSRDLTRNLSAFQCHADWQGNQPSPIQPHYLSQQGYYKIPWKRFVRDAIMHYQDNPGIAYLHFPIGGMESYPQTTPDPQCTTMLNSLGYWSITNGHSNWYNWAIEFVDYVASLAPHVQVEFEVNHSQDDVFVTGIAAEIVAKGFLVGSNGFPTQQFNSQVWGTYCPMCYAETDGPENFPSPSYFTNTILPMISSGVSPDYHPIPSVHAFTKEFLYTWKPDSPYGQYNSQFQTAWHAANPVQGPACRIPAGQH